MSRNKLLLWIVTPVMIILSALFSIFFLWRVISPLQEVNNGISFSHMILNEDLSFYMLEVDPALCDIIAAKSPPETLETVAEIAQHQQALAAVNGGFFRNEGKFADLPAGILKINDAWYATPSLPRGAIGWSSSDSHILFDQLLTSVTAKIDGVTIRVDGINRPRQDNQVILYNPYFHQRTGTSKYGEEFLIKNRKVQKITHSNTLIPNDGCILSVAASSIPSFPRVKIESDITIDVQVIPQSNPPYTNSEDWSMVANIVGGTPILIREGEIIEDFSIEKTIQSFIHEPHARTAVGVLENGHWIFVVVDGWRGFFHSHGLTIPALANLMKELGCVEALNLDGGGSSTMVVNAEVVNNPSGEVEDETGHWVRKVSDAILIKSKE